MIIFFPLRFICLYFKVKITESKRAEKRFSIHWFTPEMAATTTICLVQSWEPGAFTRFPVNVQRTKNLGLLLLSQATSRQLDQKQSMQIMNLHPCGMLALAERLGFNCTFPKSC